MIVFFVKYIRKKIIYFRIGLCIRNDVYGISRSIDCLLVWDYEKKIIEWKKYVCNFGRKEIILLVGLVLLSNWFNYCDVF